MVVSLLIILIRVPFLPARRPHWQASRYWLARSLRSAASCWAWACERAASRPGGLRCASGGHGLSSCCPTGFGSFSASMAALRPSARAMAILIDGFDPCLVLRRFAAKSACRRLQVPQCGHRRFPFLVNPGHPSKLRLVDVRLLLRSIRLFPNALRR